MVPIINPQRLDYFLNDGKTPSISRKLNNVFSLPALGVYEGDFMKFSNGIATVTLAGGHTSIFTWGST
jgi:hypothetical protein